VATKTISGTKEWSVESVNCVSGCEHDCRYCYARYNAVERFGRMKGEDWPRMRVRPSDVRKRRRKVGGTVMFPTTHDITPAVLEPCMTVLRNLLEAGNRVLVVSKPHWECILEITDRLREFRQQVLFRFTIGALDDRILGYWEPGAPTVEERLMALQSACKCGWSTSVSCEPLLEADGAADLFCTVEPWVTDTIWIGKMNRVRQRCVTGTSEAPIAAIEAGQTDQRVREIYAALKDQPKVRWKESYKRALGLREAEAAGMDV